jgi:hypothetical protein
MYMSSYSKMFLWELQARQHLLQAAYGAWFGRKNLRVKQVSGKAKHSAGKALEMSSKNDDGFSASSSKELANT